MFALLLPCNLGSGASIKILSTSEVLLRLKVLLVLVVVWVLWWYLQSSIVHLYLDIKLLTKLQQWIVVHWECDDIISRLFKKNSILLLEKDTHGYESDCVTVAYLVYLWKIILYTPIMLHWWHNIPFGLSIHFPT